MMVHKCGKVLFTAKNTIRGGILLLVIVSFRQSSVCHPVCLSAVLRFCSISGNTYFSKLRWCLSDFFSICMEEISNHTHRQGPLVPSRAYLMLPFTVGLSSW